MAQTLLGYVSGTGRGRPALIWLLVFLLLIFGSHWSAFCQPASIYRLPAGTRIRLKLDAEINSRVASVNDTFLAFVAKPVSIRDEVVVPAGTVIEGRIRGVERSGAAGRDGLLDLTFETLRLDGKTRQIDGVMASPLRPRGTSRSGILSVLGGAAAGAVVGGITRSGTGALVGAAAGAGAGTGLFLIRKGQDARLRRGEEFEIELRAPVVLPVDDF
jgi:hypothetical protein